MTFSHVMTASFISYQSPCRIEGFRDCRTVSPLIGFEPITSILGVFRHGMVDSKSHSDEAQVESLGADCGDT